MATRKIEGTNRDTSGSGQIPKSGISVGVVVLSMFFVLLLGLLNIRAMFTSMFYGFDATWQPSNAGLTFVVLLLLFNAFSKLFLKGKWLADRKMLVVVYVIVALAGFIFASPLVGNLTISMAALSNLSLTNPDLYESYYNIVSPLAHIKDDDALMGFWLGGEPVPWDVWTIPLIIWTIVFGAVLFLIMTLATFARRMWTDIEHLRFPITIPILAMIDEPENQGELFGRFWKNKLMYIGFIPPVIYGIIGMIREYIPSIPFIPMYNKIPPVGVLAEMPWNVLTQWPLPLVVGWSFTMFGIAYLVPLDICFSMWFFHWIALLQGVVLQTQGLFGYKFLPSTELQHLGGLVGLGCFTLWLSKSNIRNFISSAIHGGNVDRFDDSDEPMSGRVALLGSLVALVIILAFCSIFLKVSILVSLGYFLFAFAGIVAYARIRCEAGLPHSNTMMYMVKNYTSVFGREKVLGTNTLGLGHFWCLEYGGFGSIGALALEAYRMGDEAGVKRRSITKIIFLTYFVAAAVGFVIALDTIYEYGMFSLEYQLINEASSGAFVQTTNHLMGAERPFAPFIAAGSAFLTMLLYYMRTKFVWWPFHPIGWVMAGSQITNHLWFPMFVVWVLKGIVARYGGAKVLDNLRPIFVGLTVGSVCMGIVSVVFDNIRLLI